MTAVSAAPGWDYATVAHANEHVVGVGGALVSVVDPLVGFEAAYNTWYEQDHYYAGALAMPWLFAGRRFVATGELLTDQFRSAADFEASRRRCTYLHVYWVSVGHIDDHIAWTAAANETLRGSPGRIFRDRRHVYTGFHRFVADVSTERSPVTAHQCLDYPFGGVIIEVLEPLREESSPLDSSVLEAHLAQTQETTDVAHSVVLGQHARLSAPPRGVPGPGNPGWTTLLHFVSGDLGSTRRQVWRSRADAAWRQAYRMTFAGAFRAVTPGLHPYLEDLVEVPVGPM
jgi:hypothetical protein